VPRDGRSADCLSFVATLGGGDNSLWRAITAGNVTPIASADLALPNAPDVHATYRAGRLQRQDLVPAARWGIGGQAFIGKSALTTCLGSAWGRPDG
jgi:hypothetical protein